MATTDPGNVPEEVFLTIATMTDPIDPQECAANPMFRMVVEAGFIHGRAAAPVDSLAVEVARAAVAWRTAIVTEGEDVGEVEGALFHLAERFEKERAARTEESAQP